MRQIGPWRSLKAKLEKSLANSALVFWSTCCGGSKLPSKKWDYPETITLCGSLAGHMLKLLEREACNQPLGVPAQSQTCGLWRLQMPPASVSICLQPPRGPKQQQKLPGWTHQPLGWRETMINHCCKPLRFGLVFTLQCINNDHANTPFGFFSMCFLVNKHCVSLDSNYPFLKCSQLSFFFFPLSILKIVITYILSNISKLPPLMIPRQRIFSFSLFRKWLKMNLIMSIFQAMFYSRTQGNYKITPK